MAKNLFRSFEVFYYSQKLEDYYNSRIYGRHQPVSYFRTIFGKIKRYNEWVSRSPFLPSTWRWGDVKIVGMGSYHHSETR